MTKHHPVTEAIILAGGLGTRLREAVPDLPKCMAPVAGKPFLSYVIDALRMQGICYFVFSLGYKWEVVEAYLKEQYPTLSYTNVVEQIPLGTGGAIQLAMQSCNTEQVLIANGDTLFKIDLTMMVQTHFDKQSQCTLALKPMQNFDRYGVVQINAIGRVDSFQEKQFYQEGLINGGIYLLDTKAFSEKKLPERFSFEKDYLEKYTSEGRFYGSVQQGYFIDIGIPADFEKAQMDLAAPLLDFKKVDKSYTLFLDRDGVINDEKQGDYVLYWDQFLFSEGSLRAIQLLTQKVGSIIVVSNQRGVGKGRMSEEILKDIHEQMQKEVLKNGGLIKAIYYCTEIEAGHYNRKPNPGMAYQAFNDFPQIDQEKCIMVGNKLSDMRFGRASGMFTVFIKSTNPEVTIPHPDIDAIYPSLLSFAEAIES